MAKATDHTGILMDVASIISGNPVAAISLAGKLYDVFASELADPPPQSPTEADIAFRQGLASLATARRAAEDRNTADVHAAARGAREAFSEALIRRQHAGAPPLDLAEIEARIAACSALVNNGRDAVHHLENAYRLALPLTVVRNPTNRTTGLSPFGLLGLLPPLGDALMKGHSKIGLLGDSSTLTAWVFKGPQVHPDKATDFAVVLSRWKSGGAPAGAGFELRWWAEPPQSDESPAVSRADQTARGGNDESSGSAIRDRNANQQPVDVLIRRALTTAGETGSLWNQLSLSNQRNPLLDLVGEDILRSEARLRVAGHVEMSVALENVIAARDAVIARGGTPPRPTVDELVRMARNAARKL
jgi:hypothetical protein